MRATLVQLVLVVLLPLLLVQGGIYAAWYYTRWSEQGVATLHTAHEAATTFEAYIRDVRRQELAIGAALTGPHPYTPEQASQFLTAAGHNYHFISSWSWTNPAGKIIASSRSKAVGLDLGDRTYFRELHGDRRWAVSDLLVDRVTGVRMFTVASRIDGPKGSPLGVVVATVEVADLGGRAVALCHTVGEAIALFDRRGTLAYNSQKQSRLFQEWRGADPLLDEALASGQPQLGVLTLQADDGAIEKDIAARVPIPTIGWVAGARRPVAQTMAGVYSGLWIAVGLNLLVAVVSGSLAWRTSGSLIDQLRELQTHAQAVGRGEFGRMAENAVVRELDELAAAFNQMGTAVRDAQQAQETANAMLKQHATQLEKEAAERKLAEEALRRAADQLARSNEELEQFAYVASHDLQEPLRVVTGYVQLIERKYEGQLDADADQFFHYIVDGVTRMQHLINDLLNYSRVSTRGAPFRDVDLRAVMDRALGNLEPVVAESGAKVIRGALPSIRGDESQLVQLFQNLINNGIKFHGDHPPEIHVSARRDGSQWELAVRDNGIGIERQYWDQIFVIFQRLHTRQKYAGTGIGLAICKRIVERHGGRIWLDSQPGQGTTFHFTLS